MCHGAASEPVAPAGRARERRAVQTIYTNGRRDRAVATESDDFAICVECGNSIEQCGCVCPYCGERDKCECALFDAATGGE